MGIQEQGWLMDGVRTIFGFLDKLVYSLVKWILFGIFDLANLTANSNVFSGIYSRIYVILGIFMAFKLSFSFFQYIIDPESMSGKSEKRLSKLFTRMFVMLGALIFLPMILFGQNGKEGMLSRAQKAFLPSLPKIIFGVNNIGGIAGNGQNTNSQTFADTIEKSAEDISVFTLGGFFAPVEEIDDVCGARTYENTPKIKSLDEFSANLNLTCNKKGDIVIGGAIHTGTKYYKYSYMLFISTVVGVLIGALLLGITLSVAKRIFKLIILEVIAPIPIMSLIDPKGSKDGAFRKWGQSLLTTFGDLFIKLGIVYIIIVLIQLIVSPENGGLFTNFPDYGGFRGKYLTILLILGLIFFAKEAPKFIKEAMGLKGEGGLLDDVKSVGKAAGLVAGSAVATVGTVGAFATNYRTAKEENAEIHEGQTGLNFFRNIGSGLAGAIGHQAVTSKALMSKNGGVKAVMDAAAKRNARRASHSTLPGRIRSSAWGIVTGQGYSEKANKIFKANEDAFKELKAYKGTLEEEALKSDITASYNGMTYNYRDFEGALEDAKARGLEQFEYDGAMRSVREFSNPNVMNKLKENQSIEYADKLINNDLITNSQGQLVSAQSEWKTAWGAYRNAERAARDANISEFDGRYKNTKKSMGIASEAATDYRTDMRNIRNRANDANSSGKKG